MAKKKSAKVEYERLRDLLAGVGGLIESRVNEIQKNCREQAEAEVLAEQGAEFGTVSELRKAKSAAFAEYEPEMRAQQKADEKSLRERREKEREAREAQAIEEKNERVRRALEREQEFASRKVYAG